MMKTCSRCGGKGYREVEEGGRLVEDACYHCGTDGVVEDDVDFADRIEDLAYELASIDVDYQIEARNRRDPEDESPEDWAFCAAESMMSVHDYTQACIYGEQERYGKKISGLCDEHQEAFVSALVNKTPVSAEAREAFVKSFLNPNACEESNGYTRAWVEKVLAQWEGVADADKEPVSEAAPNESPF